MYKFTETLPSVVENDDVSGFGFPSDEDAESSRSVGSVVGYFQAKGDAFRGDFDLFAKLFT